MQPKAESKFDKTLPARYFQITLNAERARNAKADSPNRSQTLTGGKILNTC